ncbi:hypothetical protein CerSpe_134910 [Prunus speciosa]
MMASPSPPPCGPSPAAGGGGGSPPPDPVHPPCTPSPSKRMRFLPHIDPTSTDIETEAASSSSTCFHCKKQGHWVRDCPFKFSLNTPTASAAPQLYPNTAITPPSLPNVCHHPEIECNNGHGPCTAKVSRSLKNPGRIYYACLLLLPNGCQCRFFKWYDELKTNKNGSGGASGHPLSLSLSRSEYPMCSCGAGLCRLMLETSEPNAGRLYFVCPITKGHGACPFFLWYDGQANTRLTSCLDESEHDGFLKPSFNCHEVVETVNYDLDENEELSFEHPNRMTFESAEIDNPQPDSTFNYVPFGPSEIEEEPLSRREEYDDTSNMKTSTKFSNLQVVVREHLHDPVGQEEGLLDPIIEKAPHVSQKTSMQAEIHHQQIEFWRQSSVAGDTLTGGWGKDRTHQILDFQIFGWLGRLAFTPSGCLTVPPSKPKFCCVFPSLDPIFIPKETDGSHSEGLVDLPHIPSHSNFHVSPQMPSEDDAQPLSGVLFELSGIKNLSDPLQDSVVTGKIVEALEQAALPIQNLLLTLLESMDPLQHESMTRAAECTFAALDHLSVDYRRFSERVRKFIACASSLAEVERSIRNDLSSKELIKGYHNEVDRFDNISRTHDDMVGAFTTSDHRLQSLRKEASRVKEMLLQIENQLSLCEVETSELKTRVDETAKDMIETEKRLQAVAQRAEAAMKLCHQREVTRNAVKAAFDEARVKLR